jgi:hypothetical protein
VTFLLVAGVVIVAAVTFGVCFWAFEILDKPLCAEGCREWGCEHPKVSGTVDDIKPGSSNGRAALLQGADRGSIPLSGTAGEVGWH